MNLLAIDTSTENASVALYVHGEFFSDVIFKQRNHATGLLPMIHRLLLDANFKLEQLDGIVYGRGPGSFTGLRVACSVAKALAYAHDLPMYPVSCLQAIAAEYYMTTEQKPMVLTMIDARMHQVYWAVFSAELREEAERVSDVGAIVVPTIDALIVAGVGLDEYILQLPCPVLATHIIYPEAKAMIRLVLSGKITAVTPADALPVYVRNNVVQGESRG